MKLANDANAAIPSSRLRLGAVLIALLTVVAFAPLTYLRAPQAAAQADATPCSGEPPEESLGQFGADLDTFQFEGTHTALPPQALQIPQRPPVLPSGVILPNLPAVGQQGPNTVNPKTGKITYGSPGSCIAWSFGYGLGGYTAARHADGTAKWDAGLPENLPSAAFLYKYVHTAYPQPTQNTCPQGSTSAPYLLRLTGTGAPDTAQVPYEPNCCYLNGIDVSAAYQETERFRIGSFATIKLQNASLELLKEFLSNGMAIAFAGPVFQNFGIPEPALAGGVFYGEEGVIAGSGHGMLLVGYDDTKGDPQKGLGAFLVQNSFGPDWPAQQKDGPAVERGRFWLSYKAFFDTQLGGSVAYPLDTSPVRQPPLAASASDAPAAYITRAVQWAEPQADGTVKVHLILMHRFSSPSELDTVTITEPSARTARQNYHSPLNNGYSYFVRQDGHSWQPGVYDIQLTTTTADARNFTYTGRVRMPPVWRYQWGQSVAHLRPAPMPSQVFGSNALPATVTFPQ